MDPHLLEQRYRGVRKEIAQYAARYHRQPESVRLVAVGKVHGVEKIIAVAGLGQKDFAENYLQEALEKIQACREAGSPGAESIRWHFIGHIQSRKCRDIAQNFDWVHTVDSEKVAERLNRYRQGDPLNVLIQVNIDNEETKSGALVEALPELASKVSALPNLRLRGLMIIPRASDEFSEQRETFSRCRLLLEEVNQSGFNLDQLSMGMTGDLEAAIAEGATMVRIGTAIFGTRPPKNA